MRAPQIALPVSTKHDCHKVREEDLLHFAAILASSGRGLVCILWIRFAVWRGMPISGVPLASPSVGVIGSGIHSAVLVAKVGIGAITRSYHRRNMTRHYQQS